MARLLEPDGYGLVFSTVAVIQVAGFVSDRGIGKSTGRYIAEFRASDRSQAIHITRFGGVVAAISATIVTVSVYLGAGLIAEILESPAMEPYIEVGALVLIAYSRITFCRKIFQEFDQVEYAALVYGPEGTLRLLSTCILLHYSVGTTRVMLAIQVPCPDPPLGDSFPRPRGRPFL